jgi:hypothetical protein
MSIGWPVDWKLRCRLLMTHRAWPAMDTERDNRAWLSQAGILPAESARLAAVRPAGMCPRRLSGSGVLLVSRKWLW